MSKRAGAFAAGLECVHCAHKEDLGDKTYVCSKCGANLKVVGMFDDLRTSVTDWEDDEQIADYIHQLLDRQAFDRSGLVYGMGHPVYSVSDPRALILRRYAEELAAEKGYTDEFRLHERFERIAPLVIPVTMNSILTGEDVTNAMDLRCFGQNDRTWLMELQYHPQDYVLIAFSAIMLATSLVLSLGFQIGGFWVPPQLIAWAGG